MILNIFSPFWISITVTIYTNNCNSHLQICSCQPYSRFYKREDIKLTHVSEILTHVALRLKVI